MNDQKSLGDRGIVVVALFSIAVLLLLGKLLYFQVFSENYARKAIQNALKTETLYPDRGSIYDRDGALLVGNRRSFDIVYLPSEQAEFDTLAFCRLVSLDQTMLDEKLKLAKRYSPVLPSVVLRGVDKDTGLRLREKMYKFPGFMLQARSVRFYPDSIAANTLGYTGQIPPSWLTKKEGYEKNDDIGITGVENTYENILKGKKGKALYVKDVWNRKVDRYHDGAEDIPQERGKHITLTLDAALQKFGTHLMANKKGSIVAIEPESGEILALVSSPTFDPNTLVGRSRSQEYGRLEKDTTNPLIHRALTGLYPPGSTFKLVNALIGLQEGIVSKSTRFSCSGGWYYSPRLKVGCHHHKSPLALVPSIAQSCNAYYCNLFQRLINKNGEVEHNYTNWANYVRSFGLGDYLGNDLHVGKKGLVPSVAYNTARYPHRWRAETVISLSIGQDALLVTPIQMANMCTAIANRGFYFTPHIIKEIEGDVPIDTNFTKPKYIPIEKRHFETVIDGMELAVYGSPGEVTSYKAKVPGVRVCGKTGTAQNPHGEDHSIFIAFAPKDNPKIAIAVYVENGGWGSTYAVPMASLMIERYLKDTVSRPDLVLDMHQADLLQIEQPAL